MKLNIDTEWLRMMAAKEQNKILSAGGLVLQMAREAVPAIDLDAWSELFPLKAMRKLRFSLPDNLNDINALLSFFGVRSPEEWTAGWAATSVAFRQTSVVDVREEAVAAWVREAEIIAGRIPVEDFDADQLISSIDQLRLLTREPAEYALTEAQKLCAKVGVSLVIVPELPSTRISGCARWLSDKHALIALTMRYKSDDQLWFTFFHEVGHILLHRDQQSFVIDNAAENMGDGVVDCDMAKYENEANEFASEILIPYEVFDAFVKLHGDNLTNKLIREFSEDIGVGPGILVGRLQHDGFLKHWQGNDFKQKISWEFIEE